MQNTRGQERATADSGFTLVELLIVIVILGVLSTVTVFAVQGITDRGTAAASDADEQVLARAQEAHMASEGEYASEADLVAAGLLREESRNLDITVANDLMSYEIVAAGDGGPVTTATTLGGHDVRRFGSGPTVVLLVGRAALLEADLQNYLSTNTVPASMSIYMLDDPDVDTQVELSLLFVEADYVVAAGDDEGMTDMAAPSVAWFHYDDNQAQVSPLSPWYAWAPPPAGSDTLDTVIPAIAARIG